LEQAGDSRLPWAAEAANAGRALDIRQPFQQNAGRFRVKTIAFRGQINQDHRLVRPARAGRLLNESRSKFFSNPRHFRHFWQDRRRGEASAIARLWINAPVISVNRFESNSND
jgi:hypothetical protein